MIEIVENIMAFIYKHRIFRNSLYYIFFTIIGVFVFVWLLLYINLGKSDFSLKLLIDLNTYYYLISIYKRELAIFLIIEQIAFILILLYQNYKLNKPIEENEIEKIDLKDIAKIWLKDENIIMQDTLKKELAKPVSIPLDAKDSLLKVSNIKDNEGNIFIEEYIKRNLKYLSLKQIESIIKLLQLLEDNKDCPSVVSAFSLDPNLLYKDGGNFAEQIYVTLDKKTRYDIFESISLYKHSLGVAKNAITLLNEDKNLKAYKKTLLGKILIASLAHDIGKIHNFNLKNNDFKEKNNFYKLRQQQPHQQLSYIILYDSFKECPNLTEIAEAVKKHHTSVVTKENVLLKLLIDADKKTRNDELDTFLKTHKSFSSENPSKSTPKENDLNKEKLESNKDIQSIDTTLDDKNINQKPVYSLDDLKIEFKDNRYKDNKKSFLLFKLRTRLKRTDLEAFFDNIAFRNLKAMICENEQKDSDFYINLMQGDRAKALIFFYDFISKLTKEHSLKDEELKIGFALFRDCKDINDCINACDIALDEAISKKEVLYCDYKDLKAKNKKKIELFDLEQDKSLNDDTQDTNKIDVQELDKKRNDMSVELDDIASMFKKIDENTDKMTIVVETKEESFDIDSIEERFLSLLKTKINTTKQKGFVPEIQAISYRNLVLFNRECLLEILEECLNTNNNLDLKLNFLIRHYRHHPQEEKRLIWFVTVDKGFYSSRYVALQDKERIDFYCVPFDAKRSFGMEASDLETLKRSSEVANIRIMQYVRE